MSSHPASYPLPATAPTGRVFAAACLALAAAAALLAGWAPLGFSLVTVFLFAGPHNWLEARYFLKRLPARWGKSSGFFTLAFAGIVGLSAAFAWLSYLMYQPDSGVGDEALSVWLTALLCWIAALVHLRGRQTPRREWGLVWPVCFLLVALSWRLPKEAALAVVYLHPLMALWLLDRELGRSRPEWRRPFRVCVACLPLFLAALWWRLADAAPLPLNPDDSRDTSNQIVYHAGGGALPVNSHLLVSTHTFLEMLHYGVWIVAIPLIGYGMAPWRLGNVPLARRSGAFRTGVVVFLAAGVGVVLLLWGCFLADYAMTRLVYFIVALLHVLAEVPFLLRAL
jgi:hypothetical protein